MPKRLVKKIGRLSLALLENFVSSKVGKEVINELRGDYDRRISITNALTRTEKRFMASYQDTELSRAMFIDLPQKDRPILNQVVENFYNHPTDPSFPKAIKTVLLGDFPTLSKEQVEKAVNFYVELLTEEMALVDKIFQENVRTIATLRQEKVLNKILDRIDKSNAFDAIENASKKSAKVQLVLEGELDEFDRKRQEDLIVVLAALLRIDKNAIKILRVFSGSIKVDMLLPSDVAKRLARLAQKRDRRLIGIGVINVRIDDLEEKSTIRTLHPQKKQGVSISKEKYELIRKAILSTLQPQEEMTFMKLAQEVEKEVADELEGSVMWYVTTVKLDLEARGEIKRVPNSRPQLLTRTKSKVVSK